VWAATKLATDAGGWRQINRAGHPMMWPIFWPNDTDFTNPANTRHPADDVDAAAKYTGEQIAAVVAAAGTSGDPAGYGRTLADNAPEAMLSLVTNMAVPAGLKPSVASGQRHSAFPYVVPA
jgi:cysteine synthase